MGINLLIIELAFRLGLLNREEQKILDWIRRIRNDAAHRTGFSFKDSSIADKVENILSAMKVRENAPKLFEYPYEGARGDFVVAVSMAVIVLEAIKGEIGQTKQAPWGALLAIQDS